MNFNVSGFTDKMKDLKISNADLVEVLKNEYNIKVTIDAIKSYKRKNGKNAEPSNDKIVAFSKILGVSTDFLLGTEDEIKVKYIPLIGVASCGVPNIAYYDDVEYIPVPPELARDGVYAVKATGDSMLPKISDGDVVVCDKNMDANNGDIVHYTTIDGESGLKKYLVDEKGVVTLMPINTDFPPIQCDKNDLKYARAIRLIQEL